MFHADLPGLSALRGLLARAAEDAEAMRGYWAANGGMSFTGEGILNLIQSADDRVERDVSGYLDRLAFTLSATARAVGVAAATYRSVDHAAAAELDMSVRGASDLRAEIGTEPVGFPPSWRPFSDVVEVRGSLTPVPDFGREMPNEPGWVSLLFSPANHARMLILSATNAAAQFGLCDRPYDILDVFLKPFIGDWVGMRSTGYVLRQLARAARQLSVNLAWAAECVDDVWRGNGADSAEAHLHLLRKSLADADRECERIGAEYESAAWGAYNYGKMIGETLTAMADAAVAASLAAASGASGVGLPVSVVLGGYAVTRLQKVVQLLLSALASYDDASTALNVVNSAVGLQEGDFGRIQEAFLVRELPHAPALVPYGGPSRAAGALDREEPP